MQNESREERLAEVKREISNFQFEIKSLRENANLSSISDTVEDKKNLIAGFKNRIEKLRNENYVFEPQLENQAADFKRRWEDVDDDIKQAIRRESTLLKSELRKLELQLNQAEIQKNNPHQAKKVLESMDFTKENLEDKIDSAKDAVTGLYDALEKEINQLDNHLKKVESSYEVLNTASFKLLAQESLIMAVEAVWTIDGKEDKSDPKGYLFLTDQRIIFEQKQEIATKKVLFVTTERKLIQELLWAIPLNHLEEISATEQGMFKNKDFLDLKFNSQATYHQIQLHIFGQDSDDWKILINKVISGDFDKNRTEEIPDEVIEKVKNAPTICPSCGATIQVAVLRGMDQFNCEFCGIVIKL